LEILSVLKIIVALGLLNVWLFRYSKQTEYRGKDAQNLKEEFAAYGLPVQVMYLVGALKVIGAFILLLGGLLNKQDYQTIAAGIISVLMIGAIVMHVKVKDPIKKSIPASLMLIMSLTITIMTSNL
jgi:hypothetical protein